MASSRSLPTGSAEPRWRGRTFDELTFGDKHELSEPELYRTMRDTFNSWRGKTYDELNDEEQLALYREDAARFARMRGVRTFTSIRR